MSEEISQDKNDQGIPKALLRFKKQLFLVYTLGFIVLITFAISLNKSRKTELANMVLSQIKENLVLRNIRPVFISLEESTVSSFLYVKFIDGSNQEVFTLPPDYDINPGLKPFVQKISLPIYLEKDGNSLHGRLELGYSDAFIIGGAFGFWIILVLFGVLLFSRYEKQLKKERLVLQKFKEAEILSQVSKQVSHDIRSPLSALSSILNQITNVPEHQRLILRSSINRISDIANTLLQKSKEQKSQPTNAIAPNGTSENLQMSVELVPALIDSLVSEKRVQFRDKIGVEIEVDLMQSYGAFASINTRELSRLVSNTINNAVESLQDARGRIVLSVKKSKGSVLLKISDNGKGIPKHILDKLGALGVTHGKEGTQSGSGLGVYHAKKTIEQSFTGKFEIQTEEGKDTTILITLPEVPSPKWFVEKLPLKPQQQVISLDDDQSIHGIWSGRFESQRLKEIGLEHLMFTSGEEFKEWFRTSPHQSTDRLYLIDFELLNQNATGLQIIEELGIGPQSILVTSRYEESQIKDKCEKLSVRLIPKGMASLVPIEVEKPKKKFHALLIDDDVSLMHSAWAMAAENSSKLFQAFSHPDDFLKVAFEFDFETPIYVDSNLGNGIKGEVISKKIHEMGFTTIFLCTGYDPSEFPHMPWITAVVGKDPVF